MTGDELVSYVVAQLALVDERVYDSNIVRYICNLPIGELESIITNRDRITQ